VKATRHCQRCQDCLYQRHGAAGPATWRKGNTNIAHIVRYEGGGKSRTVIVNAQCGATSFSHRRVPDGELALKTVTDLRFGFIKDSDLEEIVYWPNRRGHIDG